jgi:hypothetical protein
MSRTVLRALVRTTFAVVAVASLGAGCSRQAEGERCDLEWAGPTQDCDSGLICTACGDLLTPTADRCCRADGTYTDPLCQPASVRNGNTCSTHKITTVQNPGSAGTGTMAGTGGTSGTSGTGGTDASGGTGGTDASGGTAGSAMSGGTAGESTDTAGSGG